MSKSTKSSPTAKALQLAFAEELGIQKAVPQKKDKGTGDWPDRIEFISDGNLLEKTEMVGVYRYIHSETKLGTMVKLYLEDIQRLRHNNMIK